METDWHDLSGNQQLILEVMADRDDPTSPLIGSEIKRRLEEQRDRELANSFIYPNLDTLEDLGLIYRDDEAANQGEAFDNYLTRDGARALWARRSRLQDLTGNLDVRDCLPGEKTTQDGFQRASEVTDGG